MRKSTLTVVAYLIVFPAVYLLPAIAELSGFEGFPRWSFVTTGIASVLIAAVLATVLTPLNKRLLAWRKSRGRDFEEEERYESASAMIRLTPKDDDK
ncbi:MAG: hypothetical protein QUS14_14475 [Pyrinomonadaceae bacterium]|nr:hypothetical protein [Pyrinomonadaceae bacterium]